MQYLSLVTLVVDDYDEAITFYCNTLGFQLVEDTWLGDEQKRWVVIEPGQSECATRLLLARASNNDQKTAIGNQTGGRVSFFLTTDNFWHDYHTYKERGLKFIRAPLEQPYGTVAVFADIYGNLWDLLQPK